MYNKNNSGSDSRKIILTSENNLAVKEKIERASKILMERNKKAYRELSNNDRAN